jgi:hypothetical protein
VSLPFASPGDDREIVEVFYYQVYSAISLLIAWKSVENEYRLLIVKRDYRLKNGSTIKATCSQPEHSR